MLCSLGMSGTGVDFSRLAIETAKQTLRAEIAAGKYRLIEGEVADVVTDLADLCLSVSVMEHVEDDIAFLRTLSRMVKPGGYVAICVPGRKDCWSFEDDTAGHLRRYEREDLYLVLKKAGLRDPQVWSLAVPTANVLMRLGARLVKQSGEGRKLALSQRERTETSGVRSIPWKTTFPAWARIILNPYSMQPLIAFQRLFYGTGLGVTMFGFGRLPE